MVPPEAQFTRNGLTRRLVEDGLLSNEEDALRAYRQCYKAGIPFITYLVQETA